MHDTIPLPGQDAADAPVLFGSLRETLSGHRDAVLAILRHVPAVVEAAQQMLPGDTYRVLVSQEHLHLLKEGTDGITKPWLKDASGRFVENVDLVRVGPDVAGALSGLAVQAALAQINAKLGEISRGVENLIGLVREVNRGRVAGAIDAIGPARALRDPVERRREMLSRCGALALELGGLAGQMKQDVAMMPPEQTGFWDGWWGSRIKEATGTAGAVRKDLVALAEGMRVLLGAYCELGEFPAAETTFRSLEARFREADLESAAARARLVPYDKSGGGLEQVLERYATNIPALGERVRLLASGNAPKLELTFTKEEMLA
ncbi:hypothetical protein E0493_21615 [Roseomonas sp. M0104]|uniref:Uncharacterized protein n=1 Tax=Teichococcus coralli TaxID=2545983 RepID=A0A845BRD5_9PROT|nr:hypothetical protein [Pseudoroseomonas coralli]MXP65949.1 hypothetical protein [Pseudoroseomonas coralli]